MPPPTPELTDDLVGEFLLRIPPDDDPACLLRASLVCKRWRRILADPAFRRRHRALHQAPHVFGYLQVVDSGILYSSRFVTINTASRRPVRCDLPGWRVLDCRHGRALFMTQAPGSPDDGVVDFIVWDPLTDEQHRLPRPSSPPMLVDLFTAAVLCAAATRGCDHRGCHGDPFRVVFISTTITPAAECVTSARVYSSETRDWSELTSVQHPAAYVHHLTCFSTLVGDTLYFFGKNYTIGYQPDAQRLSVIDPPPQSMYNGKLRFLRLVDDGGCLGFVCVEEDPSFCIRLLSRETTLDGVARWAQGRVIKLDTLLANVTLPPPSHPCGVTGARVIGVAQGTDAIFVYITKDERSDVYMIHLKSGRAKKLGPFRPSPVFPYVSFCIPGQQQAKPVSSAIYNRCMARLTNRDSRSNAVLPIATGAPAASTSDGIRRVAVPVPKTLNVPIVMDAASSGERLRQGVLGA
ncbi:hypothetical protein EJB05_34138, partial [Eragrostis curvula]